MIDVPAEAYGPDRHYAGGPPVTATIVDGNVVTDKRPRCEHCGKMVAWFVTRPWKLRCPHCRKNTGSLV